MTQSIHPVSAMKHPIRIHQRNDNKGEILQQKLALLILRNEIIDDPLQCIRRRCLPWMHSTSKHNIRFVKLPRPSLYLKERKQ